MPGLLYPTALIVPASKVRIVGFGCPPRGCALMDLIVTAPAPARATRRSSAFVVPSTPEARIVGFFSAMPQRFVARSGTAVLNGG